MGQPPAQKTRSRVLSEAVLRAFLTGDEAALRELLGLAVWENTPFVSVACNAENHGPAWGRCFCEVRVVRERILARIERLGRFTMADLDDDGPAGVRAWKRLEGLYRRLGLDPEPYLYDDEQEGSDG
jgi:hypothetical protein